MNDTPKRYRKRPVEVEAMRWDGTATGAMPIIDWVLAGGGTARYQCSDPARCARFDVDCPHWIAIDTLEGAMHATLGDYIVRGTRGEFYPCKPGPFEDTFEAVNR